jgi:thioredoxin 1
MEISVENFETAVLQSELPVLLDFSAAWCGPCRQMEPELAALAEEWDGKLQMGRTDVDQNGDLAMQYGVMGIPTLILFMDGAERARVVGYKPRREIEKMLTSHIGQPG